MGVPRAFTIAVIASVASCKTDDARPTPPAPARPPRPPAPVASPPDEPRESLVDAILLAEPQFANATELAPLRLVEGREQAFQTWCMEGSDARQIAQDMATTLTAAGWGDVVVLGTPERAGASASFGTEGRYQISISVGGRDARCAGRVAIAQYTSSTLTIPPLADGERIR